MKSIVYTLFFLASLSVFSQEENKTQSNFSVAGNFSIGNSMLNTEEFKNLDGSSSGFGIDVTYDFGYTDNTFLRAEVGVEAGTYNANFFSGDNQFSLYAEYLRIPLKLYGVYRLGSDENNVLSNTKFFGGIGGFMQYSYKYEARSVVSTSEINDIDTDFGYLFNLGIEQDVSKKFSVILGLESSFMGDENVAEQLNFNSMVFYIGIRYRF